MQISFNFKNFEPSDHLRDYAKKRFDKLTKFKGSADHTEVQINLSVEKQRQMADVIYTSDFVHISAHEESQDMYATIDMVLDKVLAQLTKWREKRKAKVRTPKSQVRMDVISFAESEASEGTIVETDRFEPKPMMVDEAAMQLGARDMEFMVFHNSETERVNVIYRMKSGEYGLIDPAHS